MRSDLTVRNHTSPQLPNGSATFEALHGASGDDSRIQEDTVPWARYFSALWRFKFLIVAILALGGAVSWYLSGFAKNEYEALAGIYVTNISTQRGDVGPVRTQGLFSQTGWKNLPREHMILDPVAHNLRKFVAPAHKVDAPHFEQFSLDDTFTRGKYTLRMDSVSTRYTLLNAVDNPVDSGVVGDSIGRKLGFRWAPVGLKPGEVIPFEVRTLRDAAEHIKENLDVVLPEDDNLMQLKLRGTDPEDIARTLNEINRVFINYADTLTKRKHVEVRKTLGEQLVLTRAAYDSAEKAYQNFRYLTITKPTEGNSVAGGIEVTEAPVITSYFEKRTAHNSLRDDIADLDSMIGPVKERKQSPNRFLSIGSVKLYGTELEGAIAAHRAATLRFTEETGVYTVQAGQVAAMRANMNRLVDSAIVPAAQALLAQLRTQYRTDSIRLESARLELMEIPQTTIQDRLLLNTMQTAWDAFALYSTEYQKAQMAEASAIPDVSLAYPAVAPLRPATVPAPRIIGMVMLAALAIAVALSVLLDRTDKRFRYPDQATHDLGLTVIGAVPTLKRSKQWHKDPEVAAGMVETFRSVRLALSHAFSNGEPLTVTITSPGVGEGKSLVAANLAMAMAEGGYRTLLIDGDTRRGELHATFNTERRPGLLDHLAGKTPITDAVRRTEYENLWLLPGGTRFRHGPELLMTQALQPTLNELRSRFDAIIIDTPPLSAGVDAFVLGSAAGNMVLVLRNGRTDRKLAEAKLHLLDRLPVRIIGTVLNDFKKTGAYEYYSYLDGYTADGEDEEEPTLVSPRAATPSLTTKRD